ncbi:T9SS type A sorting domain-containing protein [Chryseobacterium indoltheticum]|uniref:T9SS C-terminal target domain-containing protein n=1 Tax=Chryseobacterium indoltheticum TaxID=254 RepID=A0A3G6N280_9FLAO|nr:T9SS type A sorting domain-containing protein [Chryseobacterium indoltheticum]AZA61597.1 T9SS C-terminal target domain-containing protein [Chryseobacterium indoltheticum]
MKSKNIFLTFVLNLVFITTFAQGENNNWYFGSNAALNFTNPTPTVLNNSTMYADNACGTISDSNGDLLFYCNANSIWNRQNQIMPNGTGLEGFQASIQLAIVKNPANPKQYFVFTTSDFNNPVSSTNKITYSVVDMTLGPLGSNGHHLGDIVPGLKNIPVIDDQGNNLSTGAITVVAGASNNTYWVLIPSKGNLFSYKVTTSGFANGNPVVSSLNSPSSPNVGEFYTIKASPKLDNSNFSNYICVTHLINISHTGGGATDFNVNKVLSFDATTGAITSQYSLTVNGVKSSVPEFNKNASALFLGYNNKIYAVDLLNSTTANVNYMQIYTDSVTNRYMGIQRSKYGEVYITRNASNFLGKINNPDIYGSSMSANMNAISLYGSTRFGLPQLVPFFENIDGYHPCIDNLDLFTESNYTFNYTVGNGIITSNNYVIGARHSITMQAGESVKLLPGTEIKLGANYRAFIAPCGNDTYKETKILKQRQDQKEMVLNFDMEERKPLNKQISIHPNPTSTFINIDSGNEKINSWELYDISGRSVLKGHSTQINVQSLPKATYLIKIKTDKKQVTKKVIVK